MPNKNIRVGIVGAGPVAGLGKCSNSHAGGYARTEGCELVAVCDTDADRLHQFGKEWGIPNGQRYKSAIEMYREAMLDVVSVTTNNLNHHQPVIEAAGAGVKVILVEKPIAISVDLANKMIEACERSGSRLIVDHTRRFTPHHQKIKEMIDSGMIGQLRTVEITGSRPLLHNGTHTVDLALFWVNDKPIKVSGFICDEPVDDPGGSGMVVCENGSVIFINCIATRKQYESNTTIAGTEGRIYFSESKKIWKYAPLVEISSGYGSTYQWQDITDMPDSDYFDYYYATNEAIRCFQENRDSISSGIDGKKALELITAMHVSHKTDKVVRVPLGEEFTGIEIRSTGQ
tara:strand:+ start:9388 stop:10419 length:1032 start_codon:yes stop_codon:yes gene_type:complete